MCKLVFPLQEAAHSGSRHCMVFRDSAPTYSWATSFPALLEPALPKNTKRVRERAGLEIAKIWTTHPVYVNMFT